MAQLDPRFIRHTSLNLSKADKPSGKKTGVISGQLSLSFACLMLLIETRVLGRVQFKKEVILKGRLRMTIGRIHPIICCLGINIVPRHLCPWLEVLCMEVR
jgi:hypothetical protein